MNFDEAIAAHTMWKIRLRKVVDGHGEKLDVATVSKDNQCDLGKWIHGEGTSYKSLEAYDKLKTAHAKFHKCAAQVITEVNGGRKASADALLQPQGEFAKISTETVTAIMAIKRASAKSA